MFKQNSATRYASKLLLVCVLATMLLSTTLLNIKSAQAAITLPDQHQGIGGQFFTRRMVQCIGNSIVMYKVGGGQGGIIKWTQTVIEGMQQLAQGKTPSLPAFGAITACVGAVTPFLLDSAAAWAYQNLLAQHVNTIESWARPYVTEAYNVLKNWILQIINWLKNGGDDDPPPPPAGTSTGPVPFPGNAPSGGVEPLPPEIAPLPVPILIPFNPNGCQDIGCSGGSIVALCPDNTLSDSPDQCSGTGDIALNPGDGSSNDGSSTDTTNGDLSYSDYYDDTAIDG